MDNVFEGNGRSLRESGDRSGYKGRALSVPGEILDELRRGNHAAFEWVYRAYQADIKRFLLSLTKDNEMAEDVMQEAFLYLWEKREQVNPEKNILNYLFHIVRNMLIDRLRRNQVANKYLKDLDFTDSTLYAADSSMIAEETEILLKVVVAHMPKQRRQIYEMSRYEGLTNKEIAEKLGIDTGNVRTQLHYAMKEIKDAIGAFLLFFII